MQDDEGRAEACVVHLERPSRELNGARVMLAAFGLFLAYALVDAASRGHLAAAIADGFEGSAPDGTAYVGQLLIPAVAALLLVAAMALRAIGLAWGSLLVLGFSSILLIFSVGLVPIIAALVLSPAVWDYARVERAHRFLEPVGRVPSERRAPQP